MTPTSPPSWAKATSRPPTEGEQDDCKNKTRFSFSFSFSFLVQKLVRFCQRKVLRASRTGLCEELCCHALQTCLAVVLRFIFSAAVQQRQVVRIIRLHFLSLQLWLWLLLYCHVLSVLISTVSLFCWREELQLQSEIQGFISHTSTWIMFSKNALCCFVFCIDHIYCILLCKVFSSRVFLCVLKVM